MTGYALPSSTTYVSCSFQCHRQRNPPSSEPGTDYASGYGSNLFAVGTGKIVDLKTSNSGGTGRYITIDMDDGRRTRSLHLSYVGVSIGQRVTRGQIIGRTGASGYGSDWGYGAHVHQTLWATWAYVFGKDGPIDFEKYVGPGQIAPNQRIVGANSANGRSQPNTTVPVTQTLPPNTIADFNGWIHGENVSGNDVWFRGSHSGDWFWSGGFTDTGTHDLADLNPTMLPTQRQAGENTVNGRGAPNTGSDIVTTLAPGTVGDFDGWINGENLSGNKVWFRGAHSGAFFWSGGFTDTGTHDLADLNTAPPAGTTRTVGTNSANGRDDPSTKGPVTQTVAPGTVVNMDAWTNGEEVSGNDVWFRSLDSGDWFWSGGFTSQSTDALTFVPAPNPPTPTNPNNPRNLPEYPPVYPGADIGLVAPLGDGKRVDNTVQPGVEKIDRFIIHHTGTTVDQLDYFSYKNDRSSCPTWYLRPDGWIAELIRPAAKPASTGPQWNWRSVAVETLNTSGDPTWGISAEAHEALAQITAWLATFDGGELDGVPVEFKIDRTHVIGHNEALPGTTICPGPSMDLDWIVARALVIYAEEHPSDMVLVPRSELEAHAESLGDDRDVVLAWLE